MRPRVSARRGGNYLFNSFGPFYIREPVRLKVYMIFLLGIVIGYGLSWTVRVTLELPPDGLNRWTPVRQERPLGRYNDDNHMQRHAAVRPIYSELDTQSHKSLPSPHGQDDAVFKRDLQDVEDEGFGNLDKEILANEEEGEGPDGGDDVNTHANLQRTIATTVHRLSPVPTSHKKPSPVKSASVPYQVAVIVGEEHTLAMSYCLHATWGKGEAVSMFSTMPIEPMHLPSDVTVGLIASHSNARVLGLLASAVPSLREDVQWLVLVPDTVYVYRPRLQEVLQGMDPKEDVYLSHRQGNCSFQSGIVLSRTLFTKLYRDLDVCSSKYSATPGDYEGDSILAQCASAYGVKCYDGGTEKSLFYTDVHGLTVGAELFDKEGLTAHVFFPSLIYPKYIYRLYIYFSIASLRESETQASQLRKRINELLPFVPSRLRPPPVDRLEDDTVQHSSPIAYSKPRYTFDTLMWEYFNQSRIMTAGNEYPATGLFGTTRNEIKWALTHGLGNVKRSMKEAVTFVRLENGFRRVNPSRGLEYILDFVVKNKHNVELQKRTAFSLPLSDRPLAFGGKQGSSSVPVHFLTTISGVTNRLPDFLDTFHQNLLAKGEDVSLTIMLFDGPDAQEVKTLVDNFRVAKSVNEKLIRIVPISGPFARGRGLAGGLELFLDSDLVFIVDVDIMVGEAFPMRCRQNTIHGEQVYFPIFFKLYNPKFIQENTLEKPGSIIKRHNGHWAHYSFGMLCVYAGDYRKTSGYDTENRGWGEEDVELFKAVIQSNLEVFRSPDPGLLHRWHRKVCDEDKIKDKEVLYHCKRSRGENIADRIELANFILEAGGRNEELHEELKYLF